MLHDTGKTKVFQYQAHSSDEYDFFFNDEIPRVVIGNQEVDTGDSEEEEPLLKKRRSRKREAKKEQKDDKLYSKKLF